MRQTTICLALAVLFIVAISDTDGKLFGPKPPKPAKKPGCGKLFCPKPKPPPPPPKPKKPLDLKKLAKLPEHIMGIIGSGIALGKKGNDVGKNVGNILGHGLGIGGINIPFLG